jgi:hypothetical protein
MKTELRVDRLLGRDVVDGNNRPIGRLQEFRAVKHGTGWVISEYVIGPAALLERLGVSARRLFGVHVAGRVARWDQLDISDEHHPRLTCPVNELREL